MSFINTKKGECYIFISISDHVTLVQLINTSGIVNYAVIINGFWIKYFNFRRALPLMKKSLDIIWNPSKYKKGFYAEFEYIYYVVRYVNPKEKSANTE